MGTDAGSFAKIVGCALSVKLSNSYVSHNTDDSFVSVYDNGPAALRKDMMLLLYELLATPSIPFAIFHDLVAGLDSPSLSLNTEYATVCEEEPKFEWNVRGTVVGCSKC